MRLQRLEIAGFKSFSDRSELAFDEGVTAIVGPNGCGKSNVADAITWVLGEQSAKSLRGDRMEDVIFSGSDARKPTGSAEVRLLLTDVTTASAGPKAPAPHAGANGNGHPANGNGHTNGNGNGHAHTTSNGHSSPDANGDGHPVDAVLTAGDELTDEIARKVEVTRRLYRSGESEYLIDGHQCRLRDIHELLMDTGLGAKAYAIIEQGKIGMILSSRPADRRQLIEEAAGITKYKARRRMAELKLEAAQQNLTRVDDIIFEVEKQRGTLKRQAAKARRYRRLREELRRWEKVLLAGRYRELLATMAQTRERLADARAREAAAAARVAEIESTVARVRIELSEAEARATAARESAHAHELDVQRRQQQIELDRQQGAALEARVAELDSEAHALEARREPARLLLEERRNAAREADVQRQQAQQLLGSEQEAYQAAASDLEGLEGDVEAARSEMFAAGNAATALQHALQHAATARERVSETLSKLGVELRDVETEAEALARMRQEAERGLQSAQVALAETARLRAMHDTALTAARAEHDTLSRLHRQREHELAGLAARLRSLEELEAARAGYGDAARTVLAAANGAVGQLGAVADYVDVDRGFERAAEAVLGDLLQHVVVPTHAHAEAGLRLVREHAVGRCGFLVLDAPAQASPDSSETWSRGFSPGDPSDVPGARRLSDVVRATGPYAAAVRPLIEHAWIADTHAAAVEASTMTADPIATPEGDVVRGNGLVFGGAAAEARGILATKVEIRELRTRLHAEREEIEELGTRVASAAAAIVGALAAVEAAGAELHRQEKAIVAYDAQMARIVEDEGRLTRKSELLEVERARAEEEGVQLDRRQTEARESIVRIEAQQREADERFTRAQRHLFSARERMEAIGHRVSEAKAAHAGLVERSAALSAEVARLEDAAQELETRVADLRAEREQKARTRGELAHAVASGLRELDENVRTLGDLREAVRASEEVVGSRHTDAEAHEVDLRSARASLDALRTEVTDLEVARATAEADLSHLGGICTEALQSSLETVLSEVEQMERDGAAVPDPQVLDASESEDGDEPEGEPEEAPPSAAANHAVLTAEDAIAALRAKIDRLGPVNMMAIEQFDELETRHAFLATQRKDLVDSIAQTVEAIKRIDETSKARFREALQAINANFQGTFATLFGGGRAGLTLLDDADVLESGIDIVASPPGKRLQSVQLLSGGEKALTAIALMFAIFKYKPSPFCLLDEIDAPLDDANIGRFVEMLKGMLHHTQFILITHNRKTMEIADRLYGVTMEEPGVSKLISVRLN